MHGTAYGIAFKGEDWLMVFNPKRDGWEMPGGHIESGETAEDAVRREFIEECGYDVEVLETRDIGTCHVCSCRLLDRVDDLPEMECRMFSSLPDRLSFDRKEYEDTVPWAFSVYDRT